MPRHQNQHRPALKGFIYLARNENKTIWESDPTWVDYRALRPFSLICLPLAPTCNSWDPLLGYSAAEQK